MALDPDLRSLQEVRDCMRAAVRAQASIRHLDQAGIDRVVETLARAAADAAGELARLAVEETGIGRAVDKVQKNLFASEGVWDSIKGVRTVGVLSSDPATGVTEVATPIGVVCGIVPTTNPTSTAIGKALIALKGRNAIVISPHPRAIRCIGQTVEVLRRALERAGCDADLVQCLRFPTLDSTNALMSHADMKLILATGGAGLVHAAYSSGKPAYGVGPGNVPVYVDPSADLGQAARWITASQSFDNATLCCSEQALVLHESIAEALLAQLVERGAHRCTPEETALLEDYAVRGGHMNPDVVGKDPVEIARAAGFTVPTATTILLAEQGGVGPDHALSAEVLCPLLSVHRVSDWTQGCEVSFQILRHGGLGHTIGVWARDEAVLEAWAIEKPASRIVVNGPTSMGAVGWSTGLLPSMSLGCGPLAGNITSDNISARHLVNIKRVGALQSGFEERYAASVRRATELLGQTGSEAPRGTGLEGDPARGRGPARMPLSVDPASWVGRTSTARASSAPTPPAPPAPRAVPAAPAVVVAGHAPRPGGAVRALSTGTPSAAPTRTAGWLEALPDAGGAGCPMGPCKGCPHQNKTTGACTA